MKWGLTGAVCGNVWVATRTGRGCLCVCVCVHFQLCWGLLSENEMSLPTLSTAAPGLSLCDANCFCFSCQVPTLPQHILQTGPGPSAAFFLCLFKKRELRKRKMCFPSATTVPLPPPQTPAVAHFRRVSELWGENQENKAHEHNC